MGNKRVTDAQLTSIADAIRAKTGSSATMVFPAGFVNKIDGIKNKVNIAQNFEFELAEMFLQRETFNADDVIDTFNPSSYEGSPIIIYNADIVETITQNGMPAGGMYKITVTTKSVNSVTVVDTISLVAKETISFSRLTTYHIKITYGGPVITLTT